MTEYTPKNEFTEALRGVPFAEIVGNLSLRDAAVLAANYDLRTGKLKASIKGISGPKTLGMTDQQYTQAKVEAIAQVAYLTERQILGSAGQSQKDQ